MIEYGRYCACHPLTKREILDYGREGLTISGIECKFRRKSGYGWQSFCSKEDRLEMRCEDENFECNKKNSIEKEKKKEEIK